MALVLTTVYFAALTKSSNSLSLNIFKTTSTSIAKYETRYCPYPNSGAWFFWQILRCLLCWSLGGSFILSELFPAYLHMNYIQLAKLIVSNYSKTTLRYYRVNGQFLGQNLNLLD